METPDYEEPNHQHNLIIAICQRVDGIGKTTATHLASYVDTVNQFMNCQVQDLLAVKKRMTLHCLSLNRLMRLLLSAIIFCLLA